MNDRKPPAKIMESRDVRRTVRLTPTQDEVFSDAARAEGQEWSVYFRDCAAMGHTMRLAQAALKRTGS